MASTGTSNPDGIPKCFNVNGVEEVQVYARGFEEKQPRQMSRGNTLSSPRSDCALLPCLTCGNKLTSFLMFC